MQSSASFLNLSKKAKIHGREDSNPRATPPSKMDFNFQGWAQKEFE
jgi:hypothetical protein